MGFNPLVDLKLCLLNSHEIMLVDLSRCYQILLRNKLQKSSQLICDQKIENPALSPGCSKIKFKNQLFLILKVLEGVEYSQ